MKNNLRLVEKVAIITGSASGLGKTIALTFAREGAAIVIIDINQEEINRTVNEIKALGNKCIGFMCDISKQAQVEKAVKEIVEKWSSIDILVNNAGGALHTKAKFEEVTEKDWDIVMNVNLKGAFFCCRAVVPFMIKQGGGRIINISALAGRATASLAGIQYTSAKAGIGGLTRHLAKEMGKHNIYVNAVAPGITLSGARFEALWNEKSEEEKSKVLDSIPLGRLGKPEDVANVVLFLASDEASYITGATIDSNGGRWMF
ncbi:MAG: SDR family NAD(P)-dependent oxidoreductase [Candidatus Humimicrobiaceae bacterium]